MPLYCRAAGAPAAGAVAEHPAKVFAHALALVFGANNEGRGGVPADGGDGGHFSERLCGAEGEDEAGSVGAAMAEAFPNPFSEMV